MDTNEIKDRLRGIIVASLALDGLDPSEIGDDTNLREELGLDSIDALELVLGMEKEFGVKIQGKGLDREAFSSLTTLTSFIEARLSAAEAAE
jgi:acyl carrier protein